MYGPPSRSMNTTPYQGASPPVIEMEGGRFDWSWELRRPRKIGFDLDTG